MSDNLNKLQCLERQYVLFFVDNKIPGYDYPPSLFFIHIEVNFINFYLLCKIQDSGSEFPHTCRTILISTSTFPLIYVLCWIMPVVKKRCVSKQEHCVLREKNKHNLILFSRRRRDTLATLSQCDHPWLVQFWSTDMILFFIIFCVNVCILVILCADHVHKIIVRLDIFVFKMCLHFVSMLFMITVYCIHK